MDLLDDIADNTIDLSALAIDLKIAEDKMQVYLSCSAECASNVNFTEELFARMKRMAITAKPNKVGLELVVNEAIQNGVGINNFVLASGKKPIPPVDGKIEWTGDFFKSGYYVDPETKRIDFHQKREKPAVDEGQLLVKVQRAVHGKNGLDVFGRTVFVLRPKETNLRSGRNVIWDSEVSGYRAKFSGRVTQRGNTLDVDRIYFVKNVGKLTGNIKHNGSLVVDEEVSTDYKLDVAGDIEIKGLVYACDIKCQGNLIAKNGINGHLSKSIFIKGDTYAKYLQNVKFISHGNIFVNTEIYQSVIKTKGTLNCNDGRIIGGEIVATLGITVGQAGSKGNVKTILTAGIDHELQEKMQKNCEEISKIKIMVQKLQKGFRKLHDNVRILNDEQKNKLTQIDAKLSEAEKEILKLEEENKNLLENIRVNSDARINILDTVYPGVVLRICNSQYIVESSLKGPIVAMLDPATGEIALTSDYDYGTAKQMG